MKTLTRFLAVAFLLAVGFFAVGCASDGGGKLRILIKQDFQEGIQPLKNRVAVLEQKAATPAPTTDLGPLQNRIADLSGRLGAVEAGMANLQQGVEIAVAGSAAAKGVANQAQETANAGLKKAEAADKKATKALKIAQGELSPEASDRAKRKYTKVSASDLAEGKGEAVLTFKKGSSVIAEKDKNNLIALLEARGLKIISIVGIEDRHILAASDKEEARIKKELAEDRVQSAKTKFADWLSASTTHEIQPPYDGYSGVVILLLRKERP